jgi:branched-chain amino acid transport system permease protein
VIGFVAPDAFSVVLSINLLAGVVIGGLASLSGAVYGAFFVMFVSSVAQDISPAAPGIASGLLIIAVMFIAPTGVAGLVRRLTDAARRRFAKE